MEGEDVESHDILNDVILSEAKNLTGFTGNRCPGHEMVPLHEVVEQHKKIRNIFKMGIPGDHRLKECVVPGFLRD